MIITTRAYPRAALIGNPSDGYHGKTLAFLFDDYHVEVTLYETPELEILPSDRDHSRFASLRELVEDVSSFGYYGGVRLIKATLKKFYDHCASRQIMLDNRNFTIRYHSEIPIRLGMAGSSAIIAATTKALFAFYGVAIAQPFLPEFLLSVETEELAISAGLQDRVAQSYGGLVYMDFANEHFERMGYGVYEKLDPAMIEHVYVAYRTNLAEGSEVLHNDMRGRYEAGDTDIRNAVARWAELTLEFRQKIDETAREFGILEGTASAVDEKARRAEYGAVLHERVSPLINENYDLRHAHLPISSANHEMVLAARSAGASAKFTGSGGAIVGTFRDRAMLDELTAKLGEHDIRLFVPHPVDDGFGGQ